MRCHQNRRGCFLKFAAAPFPGGQRRGAPACLSLGNLSAPGGAAPAPPPALALAGPRSALPACGLDPVTAGEVRRSERSSAGKELTLATGRRQAGSESQQQRARHCRHPALHPADGRGLRPRRSFPGRWARVAHSSSSSASARERSVRPAPRRAPTSRKLARPRRPVFLPAPVPTLQTVHKAL